MIRGGPIALAAALAATASAAPWRPAAPLPRAVAGHAAAAHDGSLWIAGGSFWDGDVKRIESAIWRRRTTDESWERIGTLPGGFAHGGTSATAQALWLVGGLGDHGPSAAVRCVDLRTGAVREVARLPEPRAYCGAALIGETLWIVGGTPVDGDFAATSTDCHAIDTRTGGLRRVQGNGPPFINPVVLACGAELHVLPGSVWSSPRQRLEPPGDVWVFSTSRGTWRAHPLALGGVRGMSGVMLDQRHALLAGGLELRATAAVFSAQTWSYDAQEHRLTAREALPAARLAAALASDGTRVWLSGGEDGPRSRVATVWMLSLAEAGAAKP